MTLVSNARPDVQSLLDDMQLAAIKQRDMMHMVKLTDNQKRFLSEHGFQYSFNDEIAEWKIKLK